MTTNPITSPLLTVAEVAHQLRVSKMTVYRLIHTGALGSVRVGRSFRVPTEALTTMIRQQGGV